MDFVKELQQGKPNSLGNTLAVVKHVEANPASFNKLLKLLLNEDSIVAMRAMNATKRILRADSSYFAKCQDDLVFKYSKSKASVVRLGLIILYFDFLSKYTEEQVKEIKKLALKWTKDASDWMILAQGLKLLEKLSKKDPAFALKAIEIAKALQKDPRKAVAGKAKKVVAALSSRV